MVELASRERSNLLNSWNRILIDFKGLVTKEVEDIVVYKKDDIIYYNFPLNGVVKISKSKNYNLLEGEFLKNEESLTLNYTDFKQIVSLKKKDFVKIEYDEEKIIFTIKDNPGLEEFIIYKNNPEETNIAINTAPYLDINYLENNYDQATYDKDTSKLRTDNAEYSYNISYSDNIEHIVKKIDPEKVSYYIKLYNDNVFLNVVTISKIQEDYTIFSSIFVFNY